MPTRRVHLKFDEYLKEHGVIYGYTYASIVHDRMDRALKKHGHWSHREVDYYHHEMGIREWLQKWQHLAYQETLTDYLRVALGHIVLDEMNSRMNIPLNSGCTPKMKSIPSRYIQGALCQRLKEFMTN